MSTVTSLRRLDLKGALAPWIIIAVGLVAMFGPSFYDLFTGIWTSDANGHGPIIFALTIWLLHRKWAALTASEGARPSLVLGLLIIVFACLLYIVGRSQSIIIFEVGSLIWMLAGIVVMWFGVRRLKLIWFELFFMCFMLPLPGDVVDAITQPMKIAVSIVVEKSLSFLGYPVARSGVILYVGQYQLLVADACAGLQTLFTLESLGLFYLNVVRYSSAFRNITLAILIVPISFAANVIRVIVLCLITYYLGDDAGQGFLHGFAGMVLFVSALLLIISADSLLRFGSRHVPNASGAH
jgi:exosortase B